MYTGTSAETVPEEFASPTLYDAAPEPKVTEAGMLQKDALREAMIEEMERDSRVLFYGEDVADYGGAFKASKGLLERFGRDASSTRPSPRPPSAAPAWARPWSDCGRWSS